MTLAKSHNSQRTPAAGRWFQISTQDWNAAWIDPMASKREQEQERKRVKNLQERLKRRKDRLTQGLHDYALLADAKVYMLIQDRRGGITEYRSTPDRKFPPTYAQIVRFETHASQLIWTLIDLSIEATLPIGQPLDA